VAGQLVVRQDEVVDAEIERENILNQAEGAKCRDYDGKGSGETNRLRTRR